MQSTPPQEQLSTTSKFSMRADQRLSIGPAQVQVLSITIDGKVWLATSGVGVPTWFARREDGTFRLGEAEFRVAAVCARDGKREVMLEIRHPLPAAPRRIKAGDLV